MSDLVPVSENVEGSTVLGDARSRWLEDRRKFLTASDVAAVLGEDPRRGPFAVWAEKLGHIEGADHDWMAYGRDVEGAVAKGYTRRTGRPAIDLGAHVIQRHPDIAFLGATLDRRTEGSDAEPAPAPGSAPLEVKAVAGMKAKEWRDDPPLHFVIQVQMQMACTGEQWGSLVALIGGIQIVWKDLLRNERFLAAALPRLEKFWACVQTREAPEADGLPGTTDALKALYSTEDGETIDLRDDPDVVAIVTQFERMSTARSIADKERRAAENKLRRLVGSATFAQLADGSYLSLKTTNREAYEVDETSFRSLRRFWPRLRAGRT